MGLMQVIDLWQAGVATGLLIACVGWFFRALMTGTIVLGSTHKELQDAYKALAQEYKEATDIQRKSASDERVVLLERIDAQARRLDLLMDKLPMMQDES